MEPRCELFGTLTPFGKAAPLRASAAVRGFPPWPSAPEMEVSR